jgi:hypothetical protein
VIDAVDLQINGAVYLAGEVPDGLHRQLAACVQLNFGADEDDAVGIRKKVYIIDKNIIKVFR